MGKRNRFPSPDDARKRGLRVVPATGSTDSPSSTSSKPASYAKFSGPSPASSMGSSVAGSIDTKSIHSTTSKATKRHDSPSLSHRCLEGQAQGLSVSRACGDSRLTVVPDSSTVTLGLATPDTKPKIPDDGKVALLPIVILITVLTPKQVSLFATKASQLPSSISFVNVAPGESFPIFEASDIFTRTDLISPTKHWKLHSTIIARLSPWFAKTLPTSAVGATCSSFTIEEVEGRVQLVQQ